MAKLDIGDAVLTVYANTSQLDAALAAIPEKAQASMSSASSSMNQLAQTMVNTGQAGNSLADAVRLLPPPIQQSDQALQNMAFALRGIPVAGDAATVSLTETAAAADKVSYSFREAKGEAMLLGEATGIHLPRHITSFLAGIPAIGELLSAAFTATAVLFLVDALVKGTEKVSEWIADTFIFTEAQRNLNNELLSSNQAVVNYNKQIAELQKQYELIGAKGSQRTSIEFNFIVKDEKETAQQINDIRNSIFALNQGWRESGELVPVVNQAIRHLHEDMKEADIAKLLLPSDASKDQVIAAFSGLHVQLIAKQKALQQEEANQEKTFDGQRVQEAQQAAEKQATVQKVLLEQRLAAIEIERNKSKLLFDEGKIDAAQWAAAESKAVTDTTKAHKEFGDTIVDIFKKTGDAEKAHAAEMARDLQLSKDQLQLLKDTDKATLDLKQANADLAKTMVKLLTDTKDQLKDYLTEAQIMEQRNPFQQWQKDALLLNNQLRSLGIQGIVPLMQHLDDARKAEAALNAQGIHEGKLWLDVQQAKLKAIIALDQAEGKSAKAEIKALRDVEFELKKFSKQGTDTRQTYGEVMQGMKQDVGQFSLDIGTAFAAMATGQMGAAQAIEQAVGKLIQAIADRWAKYFAAMAIADMWSNPAKAAAELAAAAALEAIGGIAGSLGGGAKGAAGASGQANVPKDGSTAAQGQPVHTVNVPHLAAGGLAMGPTLAVVGDSPGGEAILPLRDHMAMQQLAEAIAHQMGGAQGSGINNYFNVRGMLSTQDLAKTARIITRGAQTGRLRVSVANSARVTKRG
jgi:hypothetical protein